MSAEPKTTRQSCAPKWHRDFLIDAIARKPSFVTDLFPGTKATAAEVIAAIKADGREWFEGSFTIDIKTAATRKKRKP